ncbi:DNA repair exonuclease [Candidatus Pacearchaeota archaeon]|nr:DNA repair exonuclease [Candidatus Pacearchaeota archaeon]
MKFAHLGDCHLGSWRYPELQEVNMNSFTMAVEHCIKEKVDMVLISGDLFDSAYPPIETLKSAFAEFKKLSDAKVPCFIIAGSHDYSSAGKTFLDVLEHAGFCKNVYQPEERADGKIMLQPVINGKYALYGFPGMKSGLEVEKLRKIFLQEAPGFFRVLMLHTALKEAIGALPIDSISISELPEADYYALGHLHIDFLKPNLAYSGPIFPNNFEELEELQYGRFQMINISFDSLKREQIPLKIKDVTLVPVEIGNTLAATERIISELEKHNLEDKIVLLRISGNLSSGKMSDINFSEIEVYIKEKKAFIMLKNISKINFEESKTEIEIKDIHNVEESIMASYIEQNPVKFSEKLPQILNALSIEKFEDEKSVIFQDRVLDELKKILEF